MYAYCLDMPGVNEEIASRVDAGVGDDDVKGLLVHVSGPCDGGWRIVDVWESEADQQRFQAERLDPAVAKAMAGSAAPPMPFDFRSVSGVDRLDRR